MKIIKADAVEYFKEQESFCYLIHQVNCQGVMNSGIAKQIRNEYPEHFEDYLNSSPVLSGYVETSWNDGNSKGICGVFSQKHYGYDGKRYTNYAALSTGITNFLNNRCLYPIDKFIIPYKIGCDRGGGDWNIVSTLLEDIEKIYNIEFICCDIKGENDGK